MRTSLSLTAGQAVTLTGNKNQDLWDSLDISDYSILDLELGIVGTIGSMTGTLSIRLLTGPQKQVDDASWVTPVPIPAGPNFPDISLPSISLPYFVTTTFNKKLLRYARWSLVNWALNGLSSVSFVIRGIGRPYPGP